MATATGYHTKASPESQLSADMGRLVDAAVLRILMAVVLIKADDEQNALLNELMESLVQMESNFTREAKDAFNMHVDSYQEMIAGVRKDVERINAYARRNSQ